MAQLYVPGSALEGRTVPDWFRIRLHNIDRALIVYWNPIRCRWIIDRCTRDAHSQHTHSPQCPTTNVRIVQTETGDYMPLCDQVFEWFGANDVGQKFNSPEDYVRYLNAKHAEHLNKLAQERKENTRHATLDGKRQLLKMRDLLQRHDMRPNEKERMRKFDAAERRRNHK